MAIEHKTAASWWVQFHPESLMSLSGEWAAHRREAFRLGRGRWNAKFSTRHSGWCEPPDPNLEIPGSMLRIAPE